MRNKVLSPTGVRMPAPLRERLKEMAETNKRSLNSEIIYHLERVAFDPLSDRPSSSEQHVGAINVREEDAA